MTLRSKTKPWVHQARELELWDSEARALLWQMRTGKTKVVIDTLGGWYEHKGLKSAIVIAPNGVHENWVRAEFPVHADYEYVAHVWHSSKKNKEILELLTKKQLFIFAVGKEAILSDRTKKVINKILRRGPCALIVDESHHFGRPGAKRTRIARGLARKCVMRRILSGTPTGNSPLRLFSQFEILEPEALGYRRYSSFERRYAVLAQRFSPHSRRQYSQVVGYQNEEELQAKVAQYASVVLREDCEDLPPLTITRHYYEMSPAQEKAYKAVKEEMVAELESGSTVEAIEPGVQLIRLQQILSNYCLTDELDLETVDKKKEPRLDALMDCISGPTIVWCRFREDLRRVVMRLRKEGITCVEYHGTVKQADRREALTWFMEGKAEVFVGQPACAGEGLDLSRAQTIVWYSHVFDVVSRDQASERATKVGGNSIAIVDLAVARTIDEYILNNLDKKHDIADQLTGRELRDLLAGNEV